MMRNMLLGALMLGAAALPSAALAQQATITQTIAGTRLDLNAVGEVTRVPDVAVITAGVVSRSPNAATALQETADKMDRVLAALKKAGVEGRDVQTSNVSLNAEYRYPENQSPQLVGYTATNSVTVRFRDLRNSGKILDTLVGAGREPDQRSQPRGRQARGGARRGAGQGDRHRAGTRRPLCPRPRHAGRAGRLDQ